MIVWTVDIKSRMDDQEKSSNFGQKKKVGRVAESADCSAINWMLVSQGGSAIK